ncbi:hypothetical protein M431DRAFT_234944, partial [Trichoderma harzianum CBS 226.95]
MVILSVWRHSSWTSTWRWNRMDTKVQSVQVLICRQAPVAVIGCIYMAPISLRL